MRETWVEYLKEIEQTISLYLNKNIIIYGCDAGGVFLEWYLRYYHKKSVKAMVDRWEVSSCKTILHLYSLYYLYDENDIILNVTGNSVIEEFKSIGEQWENIEYSQDQIIDLRKLLNGDNLDYSIGYYEWLTCNYGVDFGTCIRRKELDGDDAHGYYPVEPLVLAEIFKRHIPANKDAAFDFGCGKGAMMIMLKQVGFS